MRLPIDVTFEGDTEPTRLVAQPIDFVMWERHTKRRMSDLVDGVGMEDLAYLAWSADRRSPGEHPPFDVWLKRVHDLDESDDGEPLDEVRPTQPGASDDSSSS